MEAAAANRAHFDAHVHQHAATPEHVAFAQRLAPVILAQHPFDKAKTTVLDFACGAGLISRAIFPGVRSVVGVDVSPVSIEIYNSTAREKGIAADEMRGIVLDIDRDAGELAGASFDVVVCTMAFHHFESPERTAARLAGFLKHGGALIIVDILSREDGQAAIATGDHHAPHLDAAIPHKMGFSESQARAIFEGAGLGEFHMESAGTLEMKGRTNNLFIARGIKL